MTDPNAREGTVTIAEMVEQIKADSRDAARYAKLRAVVVERVEKDESRQ